MGLTNEMTPADVAAVTGGNNGAFGNDGAFWLVILFLFAAMGGWGNGWGGNGGTGSEVQRGFDQQAVMNGLDGIGAAIAANQAGLTAQINSIAMMQQNSDCQTRQEIGSGIRDIITNQTANTQAILDKLCQQEIDALKTQNANLQTQINLANLQASQTAQTARILSDNAAQTLALEQYLNPTPIPAYVVQNPNCCTQNYGCGCGNY